MASSLLFSTGGLAGRRFLLPEDRAVVLGTGPLPTLEVPGTVCEPIHCVVLPDKHPNRHVVVDAWTRSGTRVNGSPVEKAAVGEGDVAEVGGCRFRVVPAEEGDPPAPVKDHTEPCLYSVVLEGEEPTPVRCDGVLLVGRAPSADLCLDDDFLSWHHCLLAAGGPERLPLVLDLRSRNGTWVNGRLVRRAFVTPGAAVQVGHSVLRFRRSTPAAEAAVARATSIKARAGPKRRTTAVVGRAEHPLAPEAHQPEEPEATEVVFDLEPAPAVGPMSGVPRDYLEFFGFQESPFTLTADPDFFFPAPSHSQAIVGMQRWFGGDRPVGLLVGGAGCGKTILLAYLARQLGYYQPRPIVVQPGVECVTAEELIAAMVKAARTLYPSIERSAEGGMSAWGELVGGLSRDGVRVAVLVDDADAPARPLVRELHRLLAETAAERVCRIALAGRQGLGEALEDAPLAERAEVVATLGPLSPREVGGYLSHRVRVASGAAGGLFSAEATELIAEHSRGVPRLISNLADMALFAASRAGAREVTSEHVREAIRGATG